MTQTDKKNKNNTYQAVTVIQRCTYNTLLTLPANHHTSSLVNYNYVRYFCQECFTNYIIQNPNCKYHNLIKTKMKYNSH